MQLVARTMQPVARTMQPVATARHPHALLGCTPDAQMRFGLQLQRERALKGLQRLNTLREVPVDWGREIECYNCNMCGIDGKPGMEWWMCRAQDKDLCGDCYANYLQNIDDSSEYVQVCCADGPHWIVTNVDDPEYEDLVDFSPYCEDKITLHHLPADLLAAVSPDALHQWYETLRAVTEWGLPIDFHFLAQPILGLTVLNNVGTHFPLFRSSALKAVGAPAFGPIRHWLPLHVYDSNELHYDSNELHYDSNSGNATGGCSYSTIVLMDCDRRTAGRVALCHRQGFGSDLNDSGIYIEMLMVYESLEAYTAKRAHYSNFHAMAQALIKENPHLSGMFE